MGINDCIANNQRDEYFDLLRGIAIIFVIAIHSHGNILDTLDYNTFRFHSTVVWRQFIGCAVPIFLAISGYFLSKKDVSTKDGYLLFQKKQIPRVYIPVLIWSIPYLAYNIYIGSSVLKSLVLFFICGFSVYYFVLLVMQYYILLPFMQKMGRNKKGVTLSVLISSITIICFSYINKVLEVSLPLVVYAGLFTMWIMFFVMGVYIGNNRYKIHKHTILLLVLIILSLGLSVGETYFYFDFTNSYSGQGIKLGAFIYSFFAILFLFSINNKKFNTSVGKLLVYIGRISFGIYLIHMYVIDIIRRCLSDVYEGVVGSQALQISLTLAFCILIITIAKKLNNKFSVKYLGF